MGVRAARAEMRSRWDRWDGWDRWECEPHGQRCGAGGIDGAGEIKGIMGRKNRRTKS